MHAISRILCPIDLSEVSKHAVDHAVLLARWYDARLTVFHVCTPIVVPSADFAVVVAGPAGVLTSDDVATVAAKVRAYLAGTTAGSDVDVVVEGGHAAQEIVAHAKALPADLIVMGTHGIGGFEHLVLGSVTERVLRKATCPVLTVPPRAGTIATLPYKRVVCPVDFSDSSLEALTFAFSLAQQAGADLTIVHVFEMAPEDEPLTYRPITVPEYLPQVEHDIAARLQALLPDAETARCRPRIRIAHGKPYREILGIATEQSADLIVMGVHGRNPLDVMLFGSTTNQVVRRATCPVLTLRK